MMKLLCFYSLILCIAMFSCRKNDSCLPPSSDELYIVLKDSLGSNLIEKYGYTNDHPLLNCTGGMATGGTSHHIQAVQINYNGKTEWAWQFSIDNMENGCNYIFGPDSLVDEIEVYWKQDSMECGNKTYYFRAVEQVIYNDSLFAAGGIHEVIR